jgi:hypothetical protein
MSTEEFNALPEDARRFISTNAGCLGCGGNKELKLTKAYELYLIHKKMNAFQLFGGGVNYKQDDEVGVLYPISKEDSDFQIRKKIKIAKLIYKKNPELFISFNQNEIDKVLNGLKQEKVVVLEKKFKK